MEKKSSIKDVHKVIQKDLTELHKSLNLKLGADNPFAKFSIGGGFYLWSDTRYQWSPMISASEIEQTIINEYLNQIKTNVANKLGEKTSELLFTIPDDSYIYYYDDDDKVRILITGWGFKKPVRISGKADHNDLNKKNPVSLAFIYDGEKLQDYEFGIILPKQIKKMKTDSTGIYRFSNLKVGEKYTIKDLNSDNDYTLYIEDSKNYYEFDLTVFSELRLSATINGQPAINEFIFVSYRDQTYEVETNSIGNAVIRIPFYEGSSISAKMHEQTKTETLDASGNDISFCFEKTIEKPETDVEVSVFEDSHPIVGINVKIEYAGNKYSGITKNNGVLTQHLIIVEEETCKVFIPDFASQSKLLNETQTKFLFEKTTTPSAPEPSPTPKSLQPSEPDVDPIDFSHHILIEGNNGFIGSKYPIYVKYNEITTSYISDENGIVQLPNMTDKESFSVQDGLHSDNTAKYQLDSNQLEYIFHVPYEPKEESQDIKIMFRDYDGNPIKCDKVRFQQGDEDEYLITLDKDGNTYFSKDEFVHNELVTTTIMGRCRDYGAISFAIDDNEKEYLLQEKNVIFSWWKVLLQLLIILFTIVFLYFLWPFFERFCSSMFDLIFY